eukprot:4626582-Ditylum_brightwellii.AAC.1
MGNTVCLMFYKHVHTPHHVHQAENYPLRFKSFFMSNCTNIHRIDLPIPQETQNSNQSRSRTSSCSRVMSMIVAVLDR